MHYCPVICRVSSTDQIYHRAAKRRGDKFDRSMTRRMKTRNSHGLLQLGREALAYCQCASALISGNKALFVSVDLIGEKNQVILELFIKH